MCENDKKIEEWVQLCVENEDLVDYTIEVQGKGSKVDGYMGDIIFVTVIGTTKKGQPKSLNLVIKASKDSETLRQQAPVKEAFEKEIFVFDHILKTFDTFQKERGAKDLLDFLPKCYVTHVADNSEVLILENLKTQGFDSCDRKVPMTFDHVKLILQAYGRWHAFSFALKSQKRELFEKLTQDNINIFGYFLVKTNMIDLMLELFITARDGSISSDDSEILEKLQFSKNDVHYTLNDFVLEDPDYLVLTHADCWNNNYMFKWQEDTKQPTSVRIIDWQCCGLGSPVVDLSHFIYTCNDTGKHKDVGELLKIYNESLSQCLSQLGCDADKLYPYSKLVEHWKKFSRYGIVIQPFSVKFSILDENEAPDFVESAEKGDQFLENFNVDISNEEIYFKRTRDNFLHYIENLKSLK